VAAARDTFAAKGFDGTTTRELARAAGVSEALLYKYFPGKESLDAAMLQTCGAGPEFAEFTRALALPPSPRRWRCLSTSWSPTSSWPTIRRRSRCTAWWSAACSMMRV